MLLPLQQLDTLSGLQHCCDDLKHAQLLGQAESTKLTYTFSALLQFVQS